MDALSLQEAQLFRILATYFGRERTIPHMRVIAVCGGEVPQLGDPEALIPARWLLDEGNGRRLTPTQGAGRARGIIDSWARHHRCLFTIVDAQDRPKLVVEFFAGFGDFVDPQEEERQRFLQPLLAIKKIGYVTLAQDDFADLQRCESALEFFTFIQEKLGEGASSSAGDPAPSRTPREG